MKSIKISRMLLDQFMSNTREQDKDRRIGTSTGVALGIISTAMRNPELAIVINECDNRLRNESLAKLVLSLLNKLGLEYFRIDYTRLTLTYYPFVDIEIID